MENSTDNLQLIREKTVIRTSVAGIITNLFLVAFKAFIGLASHSVAVISDAVNNLTDALSSVITIVGTKLAGKAPDKKHPLGYGRIEYLSAMIVSAIVLYAGITALVDAVKKIIHPETPEYSTVSLIIIAAAVVVKLLLGTFTIRKGTQVNSGSLIASGKDARNDAVLSASVLASAMIYFFFHISLEAWVGAVIGVLIIKAGLEMISEAVNEMLGMRVSSELSGRIRGILAAHEEVRGVYDLLLNNYGPDRYIASVHVEVDEQMTARQFDALTRTLQLAVYKETGVILATVGLYSVNTGSDEAAQLREEVCRKILSHEGVLQFHGFYADTEHMVMTFDIILDFAVADRNALYREICEEITAAYPEYKVHITLDVDVAD